MWTRAQKIKPTEASMDRPIKVLFITGEVHPFTNESDVGTLTRCIPEELQTLGNYETRIMMPRYGTISERKNSLHEVIRLRRTKVRMGRMTETLTVKVTAIPGTRRQVYFIDNKNFFKRKGLHQDKLGNVFEDNATRALFFARSVLETVRKMQWQPDVVHALGWISGFVPLMVTTEYKNDPLFESAKIVYTPDDVEANATVSHELVKNMKLSLNGDLSGMSMTDLGKQFSDLVAYPPSLRQEPGSSMQFSAETEQMIAQAGDLYENLLSAEAV